jgi:hypothetical protein
MAFLLLERAEQLMGPSMYDPVLLLTLAMDDHTLQTQTCYGRGLLRLLEPLLPVHREELLLEARRAISCPEGSFCMEMLRRVAGMTKQPKASSNSKKDKLLEDFLQLAGENAVIPCPSLLQMVYKSGARKHFLAERWVDTLHLEMQELATSDNAAWLQEAARELLQLKPKKKLLGGSPMQVVFTFAHLEDWIHGHIL